MLTFEDYLRTFFDIDDDLMEIAKTCSMYIEAYEEYLKEEAEV